VHTGIHVEHTVAEKNDLLAADVSEVPLVTGMIEQAEFFFAFFISGSCGFLTGIAEKRQQQAAHGAGPDKLIALDLFVFHGSPRLIDWVVTDFFPRCLLYFMN
jgi:hypothetical protein